MICAATRPATAPLEALSHVLLAGRREADRAFRVGGDEFALILPEVGEEEAITVIDRIRQTLDGSSDEHLAGVSISFGVAVFPDHGRDAEALFRAADDAMYQSKRPPSAGDAASTS